MPLLVRGLRQDNPTAIKRKACLIIENMAKLVDNPLDAVPFLPKLLPGEFAGGCTAAACNQLPASCLCARSPDHQVTPACSCC